MCGASECNAFVYQKTISRWRNIGKIAVQSNGGEIGLLKSKNSNYLDISALVYDRQMHRSLWKKIKYNGSSYTSTYQTITTPEYIILKVRRGFGIRLSQNNKNI